MLCFVYSINCCSSFVRFSLYTMVLSVRFRLLSLNISFLSFSSLLLSCFGLIYVTWRIAVLQIIPTFLFFQYYYVYLNDRFNSLCYTCQFYSLSKDLHFKSCFRSWKIASFQCYSFTLISTGCFFFFFLLVLNI